MGLAQASLPGVVSSLYRMARSGLYQHLADAAHEAPGLFPQQPAVSTKVGRNEPGPCGSAKKYKKSCGSRQTTLH